MGKVDAFDIEGLAIWFWSDDHIPPHFHVKKAGTWEIKVNILETQDYRLSYEIKWGDVAATQELTVVMADPGFTGSVPRDSRTSVVPLSARLSEEVRHASTHYFVLSAASSLEPVAEFVHQANTAHKLRALFVRADVECTWFLPMFERANLRTLRNALVHTDAETPERVINAWQRGAQTQLIADATVTGGLLFVRDCALNRLEVAFAAIPALSRIPEGERGRFTIDSDGSFLHWEAGDTHVGLDMIRYALDPESREQCRLERLGFDVRFGSAVRGLRLEYGLRQRDIEGISDRQVSRIESGAGAPRYHTIVALAKAHDLSAAEYLDKVSEELVRQVEASGNSVRT